jgi:hypothetical protein
MIGVYEIEGTGHGSTSLWLRIVHAAEEIPEHFHGPRTHLFGLHPINEKDLQRKPTGTTPRVLTVLQDSFIHQHQPFKISLTTSLRTL